MKKSIIYFVGLILLVVTGSSCEKIIAKDITNVTPILITPSLEDTLDTNPIHFKWEEVEGAENYRLEVVSPSFGSVHSFDVDSMITGTDFFIDLDSNEYEVRLTALNAGYTSVTTPARKFWLTSNSTSGTGGLVLTTPLNGAYVNDLFDGQFAWTTGSPVTSCEFSLRKGSSFAAGVEIENLTNISSSLITYQGSLEEGEYHWGVIAHYTSGESTPYVVQNFFVDTVLPPLATLISPANIGIENQGSVTFTWSLGNDTGGVQSPVSAVIEVANDVGFTDIIESDSVTGTTHDFTLTIGTYYWRVKTIDEAGNETTYTSPNQFTVS